MIVGIRIYYIIVHVHITRVCEGIQATKGLLREGIAAHTVQTSTARASLHDILCTNLMSAPVAEWCAAHIGSEFIPVL